MKNLEICFEPLKKFHFSLIHDWFNRPHVQTFYSLRPWAIKEIYQKLTPYLHRDTQIKSYIIYLQKYPLGYIQSYSVKKYPWEHQDLSCEIIHSAAGLDLFIGEKKFIGKGLGYEIVNIFLKKYIWPYYQYCLVDPDIRNESSICLFQKCGFRKYIQILSHDALKRPVTLQLLIKEKTPNKF